MLRREKKNYIESQKLLEEQIKNYEQESAEKLHQIEQKKKRAEDLRDEIVKIKENDLNTRDPESAIRVISGTARSMGIEVVD